MFFLLFLGITNADIFALKGNQPKAGLGELLGMTRAAFSKEGIEPLSETVKKIRNLKSEDILDVANEIFDKDNINIMIYKGL